MKDLITNIKHIYHQYSHCTVVKIVVVQKNWGGIIIKREMVRRQSVEIAQHLEVRCQEKLSIVNETKKIVEFKCNQ